MTYKFIQPGKRLTLVAPSTGVTSGNLVKIGDMFGIAGNSALSGEPFDLEVGGVYELPKTSGASTSAAAGATIYWDATNAVTTLSATSNTKIGVAIAPTVNADVAIKVRLNEAF